MHQFISLISDFEALKPQYLLAEIFEKMLAKLGKYLLYNRSCLHTFRPNVQALAILIKKNCMISSIYRYFNDIFRSRSINCLLQETNICLLLLIFTYITEIWSFKTH